MEAMPEAAMPRILIVDDDRALCALLADYLQREGFAVDVAHDGESALAQLRQPALRPDLLILDVMMPGRDGLETLRELRMQHRLPVIMLSAKGEPVDRVIGLELGADDYLAKPCLPRELLARVRAQLRRNAPATAANLQEPTASSWKKRTSPISPSSHIAARQRCCTSQPSGFPATPNRFSS